MNVTSDQVQCTSLSKSVLGICWIYTARKNNYPENSIPEKFYQFAVH